MSTTDAADVLEITEDNVKVRLHRARALLRKSLYARAGMERKQAFTFHAVRCDQVVKNLFERISKARLNNGKLCGDHAVTLELILRRSIQSVRRLDL
jgi:RNA polymerase sigma-70 factor (ECF subfamily)